MRYAASCECTARAMQCILGCVWVQICGGSLGILSPRSNRISLSLRALSSAQTYQDVELGELIIEIMCVVGERRDEQMLCKIYLRCNVLMNNVNGQVGQASCSRRRALLRAHVQASLVR